MSVVGPADVSVDHVNALTVDSVNQVSGAYMLVGPIGYPLIRDLQVGPVGQVNTEKEKEKVLRATGLEGPLGRLKAYSTWLKKTGCRLAWSGGSENRLAPTLAWSAACRPTRPAAQ